MIEQSRNHDTSREAGVRRVCGVISDTVCVCRCVELFTCYGSCCLGLVRSLNGPISCISRMVLCIALFLYPALDEHSPSLWTSIEFLCYFSARPRSHLSRTAGTAEEQSKNTVTEVRVDGNAAKLQQRSCVGLIPSGCSLCCDSNALAA